MATATAQTIFRNPVHNTNFTIFDNDCLRKAIFSLSGDAFRIWSFALSCMPNFSFKKSSLSKKFNLHEKKIQRLIKEMKDVGLANLKIIREAGTGQVKSYQYMFYETPLPVDKRCPAVEYEKVKEIRQFKSKSLVDKQCPAIPIIKEVSRKAEVTSPAAAIFDFETISELSKIEPSLVNDIKARNDLSKDYILEAIRIAKMKVPENPGAYLNGAIKKGPYQSIQKSIESKQKEQQESINKKEKAVQETQAAKELADKVIDFQYDQSPIIAAYSALDQAKQQQLFEQYLSTIQNEIIRIKTQRLGAETAIKKITYQLWLENKKPELLRFNPSEN